MKKQKIEDMFGELKRNVVKKGDIYLDIIVSDVNICLDTLTKSDGFILKGGGRVLPAIMPCKIIGINKNTFDYEDYKRSQSHNISHYSSYAYFPDINKPHDESYEARGILVKKYKGKVKLYVNKKILGIIKEHKEWYNLK